VLGGLLLLDNKNLKLHEDYLLAISNSSMTRRERNHEAALIDFAQVASQQKAGSLFLKYLEQYLEDMKKCSNQNMALILTYFHKAGQFGNVLFTNFGMNEEVIEYSNRIIKVFDEPEVANFLSPFSYKDGYFYLAEFYFLRGLVHGRMNNQKEAIMDINKAIQTMEEINVQKSSTIRKYKRHILRIEREGWNPDLDSLEVEANLLVGEIMGLNQVQGGDEDNLKQLGTFINEIRNAKKKKRRNMIMGTAGLTVVLSGLTVGLIVYMNKKN